jgi:hypothetical protein
LVVAVLGPVREAEEVRNNFGYWFRVVAAKVGA